MQVFYLLLFAISPILCQAQNLIPFQMGDKYGYANPKGEIVLPCTFEEVSPFYYDNFAFIKTGNAWHLLHKTGQIGSIGIEIEYPSQIIQDIILISPFTNTDGIEKDTIHNLVRILNRLSYYWGIYDLEKNSFTGFIYKWKRRGNEAAMGLTDLSYENRFNQFKNGLLVVEGRDSVEVILDTTGTEIINSRSYDFQLLDHNGYIRVSNENRHFALVSPKGERLTNYDFSYIGSIAPDMFCVVYWASEHKEIAGFIGSKLPYESRGFERYQFGKTEKMGLLNGKGQLLIDTAFSYIQPLFNGFFEARSKDSTFVFDQSGKLQGFFGKSRLTANHLMPNTFFSQQQGKVTLVNLKDSLIFPNQYEQLSGFDKETYYFRQRDSCGLLTRSGELIFQAKGNQLRTFSDSDLLSLIVDRKVGLISRDGRIIQPAIYDQISESQKGYFQTIRNNKHGLLGKDGKVLAEPVFPSSLRLIFRKNKSIGFYLRNGISLYDIYAFNGEKLYTAEDYPRYRDDDSFELFKYEGKYGLADSSANCIVEPVYNGIYVQNKGRNKSFLKCSITYDSFDLRTWQGDFIATGKIKRVHNPEVVLYSNEATTLIDQEGKIGFKSDRAALVVPLGRHFVFERKNNINALYSRTGKFLKYVDFTNVNYPLGFYAAVPYYFIFRYEQSDTGATRNVGIIDSTGITVLPPIYQKVQFMSENEVIVKKSALEPPSIYNLSTKAHRPFKYDWISYFEIGHGYFQSEKNGLFGICDSSLTEIVPPKYNYCKTTNHPFLFEVRKQNKRYLINIKGQELLEIDADADYWVEKTGAGFSMTFTIKYLDVLIWTDENGVETKRLEHVTKIETDENYPDYLVLTIKDKKVWLSQKSGILFRG